MAQLFPNFIAGLTTDSPLSNVATTFNSPGLANLPTIVAPDYVYVVLDPDGDDGAPEVVQVTAHAGSATSATIVRGRQSTSAREHASGTTWIVSATKADFDELPFRKVTTKGDLLVATAANTVTRLALGAANTIPVVDSAQATGLKYQLVATASIADSAVTTAKIGDSQVTSVKIANGTITLDDLSAALIEVLVPAGTIRPTIYTSADTGWLLLGQTVTGAESLYPTLWSKAPAAWKSGSDLVLPTDDEMVLRGNTTGVGDVSGTNTKTIATTNLPSHSHTINHDHPAGTTGNNSVGHTHTFSFTTSTNGNHSHSFSPFAAYISGFDANLDLTDGGGSTGYALVSSTGADGNHNHTGSGTTSSISANHTHTFNVASFSGSSGSTGSGTALNVQEAGINVRFQIKAH